jgi:Gamma-glutamyl cyclotransferase, AIG2-like
VGGHTDTVGNSSAGSGSQGGVAGLHSYARNMSRRIAVFFYGLFMDASALREQGVHPAGTRRAKVNGFSLRIGQRAALVPDRNGHVFGIVMELSHDDVDRLYSEPSVRGYRPEAVSCEFDDGTSLPALCFNLALPPAAHERNPEYAQRLKELARRLELPQSYIDTIGA